MIDDELDTIPIAGEPGAFASTPREEAQAGPPGGDDGSGSDHRDGENEEEGAFRGALFAFGQMENQ